jgi:hypothetical protein
MTTPIDTLFNIGKLFTFFGAVMFVFLSINGQMTYWFRARNTKTSDLPKKYRFLAKAALWECWFFAGWFALFVTVALCRVLWRLVTTGW